MDDLEAYGGRYKALSCVEGGGGGNKAVCQGGVEVGVGVTWKLIPIKRQRIKGRCVIQNQGQRLSRCHGVQGDNIPTSGVIRIN